MDKKDIPQEDHWALISNYTTSESDGYGRYGGGYITSTHINYKAFKTEKEMLDFLKFHEITDYRAFRVQPLTVETTIYVKTKPAQR